MTNENKTILFKNEWVEVSSRTWETLDHPYTAVKPRTGAGACVIPIRYTAAGAEVLVLAQPRLPAGGLLWEFPAGGVDEGETPLDAAVRELGEEINIWVEPEELIHLGSHYLIPGILDEILHLYALPLSSTYNYETVEPQAGEIFGYKWLTIEELLTKAADDPTYSFDMLGKLVLIQQRKLHLSAN